MKLHPTAVEGVHDLSGRRDIGAYAKELLKRVDRDQQDMSTWMDDKVDDYEQRFGIKNEKISFPWDNASSVRSGLSDIHCEEIKAPAMNMRFGSTRIYNMVPRGAGASPRTTRAANIAMDDLLKYRMPDYVMQYAWGIDSWAMHGVRVNKSFYDYRTRTAASTIRKGDLPSALSSFAVFDAKDITVQMRQLAASVGKRLVTKQEFDKAAPQIKMQVMHLYDLDPKEKVDVKAAESIMDFLRNGSGESKVTFKTRRVIVNTPRLINVPIEEIIVPQGTRSIEDAERVVHRLFFSDSDIRQRAHDEVWDGNAVDTLLGKNNTQRPMAYRGSMDTDRLSQAKAARYASATGQLGIPSLYEVWEVYAPWDIDGDDLDERCVLTLDPNTGAILKAIELPFDHGEWPFSSTFFEAVEANYFAARGVPRKILNFEKHATALMRGELNGLSIETARSFTYVEDSGFNPAVVTWMPSLMIPVRQQGDVQPIEMAPRSLALESPMRNMFGLAERTITGRSAVDAPEPERRTAAQVGVSENARQRVLSVRAQLLNDGDKRDGRLLWSLFKQYGPDEWYAQTTGEQPEKLTQAQIVGEYDVCPVGAAGDMDPVFKAQQAAQFLDVTLKLSAALSDDPTVAINITPAFEEWATQTYPQLARQVIIHLPPEQVQAKMQQQQAMAQELAMYEKIAQKVIQNAPVDEKEALALLTYIQANTPHKQFQQIILESQQARRATERGAMLAQANANGAAA